MPSVGFLSLCEGGPEQEGGEAGPVCSTASSRSPGARGWDGRGAALPGALPASCPPTCPSPESRGPLSLPLSLPPFSSSVR